MTYSISTYIIIGIVVGALGFAILGLTCDLIDYLLIPAIKDHIKSKKNKKEKKEN